MNERQNILIGQQNALIGQLIHVDMDRPTDTKHSSVPKAIESNFCQTKQVIILMFFSNSLCV